MEYAKENRAGVVDGGNGAIRDGKSGEEQFGVAGDEHNS